MKEIKNGCQLIAEERAKQIEKHGYTPEHDSAYNNNELILAAIAYLEGLIYGDHIAESLWPFEKQYLHLEDGRIGTLKKAGAFIAAELDRIELTK